MLFYPTDISHVHSFGCHLGSKLGSLWHRERTLCLESNVLPRQNDHLLERHFRSPKNSVSPADLKIKILQDLRCQPKACTCKALLNTRQVHPLVSEFFFLKLTDLDFTINMKHSPTDKTHETKSHTFPMDPFRSSWIRRYPYGSAWVSMDTYGSPWVLVHPYGSLLIQFCDTFHTKPSIY